jgi:hypothetical protein
MGLSRLIVVIWQMGLSRLLVVIWQMELSRLVVVIWQMGLSRLIVIWQIGLSRLVVIWQMGLSRLNFLIWPFWYGRINRFCSSPISRSSSIEVSVKRSFCFLLSTVFVSREDGSLICKGENSPSHVAPAE